MIFSNSSCRLSAAKHSFSHLAFATLWEIRGVGAALTWALRILTGYEAIQSLRQGSTAEFLGKRLAHKLVRPFGRRWMRNISYLVRRRTANNALAKRTPPLAGPAGWRRMIVVFHDADAAGRHIDIHIGDLSLVKRLPANFKLSFSKNGELTDAAKLRIMDLIKAEFKLHARLAQNLDHSDSDASTAWTIRDASPIGYGAGESRQIVSDEPVYAYPGENALHVNMPHILGNQQAYIYQLYPAKTPSSAPILSVGVKKPAEPKLEDKLHLKPIMNNASLFASKIGPNGDIRIKYDGASCYIVADRKGATIWSPRTSSETGRRIEYLPKLPGAELLRAPKHLVAMGELLFKDQHGRYLKASEIAGILNANKLDPKLDWEIRVYRADKLGLLDQRANHKALKPLLKHDRILLPKAIPFDRITKVKDIEGLVGVPPGKTLAEGYKLKFRSEPVDGVIEEVDFHKGANGGIAGVVWYRDDKTGKLFKTSSGFSHALKYAMANKKSAMKGVVMKLNGFNGHRNRAVKFSGEFHQDKGKAPPASVLAAI